MSFLKNRFSTPKPQHRVMASRITNGLTITLHSEPAGKHADAFIAHIRHEATGFQALGTWNSENIEGKLQILVCWMVEGKPTTHAYDLLDFNWTERAVKAMERVGMDTRRAGLR